MVLRIRQKLKKSNEHDVPLGNSVQDMLRERINDITRTLPDDLKIILNHNSWHFSKNFLFSILCHSNYHSNETTSILHDRRESYGWMEKFSKPIFLRWFYISINFKSLTMYDFFFHNILIYLCNFKIDWLSGIWD